MSTIIIDRDTCTMVLDSAELTADRVRPCVDAIADAVETALEADGVEGVEVVREYRTTATAEDARDGYVIELECARERARIATQAVIDAIGSVGPESVEQAVPRLVAVMREARERAVRAEAVLTRGGAAIVDEPAERSLYDARAALRDLVAALALDDGPRIEAIRRARETLEGWGMR